MLKKRKDITTRAIVEAVRGAYTSITSHPAAPLKPVRSLRLRDALAHAPLQRLLPESFGAAQGLEQVEVASTGDVVAAGQAILRPAALARSRLDIDLLRRASRPARSGDWDMKHGGLVETSRGNKRVLLFWTRDEHWTWIGLDPEDYSKFC